MLVENMPFNNPDILDEDFRQRIMYLSGWNLSHRLPDVVDDYMAGSGRYCPPRHPTHFEPSSSSTSSSSSSSSSSSAASSSSPSSSSSSSSSSYSSFSSSSSSSSSSSASTSS